MAAVGLPEGRCHAFFMDDMTFSPACAYYDAAIEQPHPEMGWSERDDVMGKQHLIQFTSNEPEYQHTCDFTIAEALKITEERGMRKTDKEGRKRFKYAYNMSDEIVFQCTVLEEVDEEFSGCVAIEP